MNCQQPSEPWIQFAIKRRSNGRIYEVVKGGSTNPDVTGAVESHVAVPQVDSKTGKNAAGAETGTEAAMTASLPEISLRICGQRHRPEDFIPMCVVDETTNW